MSPKGNLVGELRNAERVLNTRFREVGSVTRLVKLVKLRVKEFEVRGSSSGYWFDCNTSYLSGFRGSEAVKPLRQYSL
ncbi:hypothetical protein L195_g034698 [Trifolium pratense]|uniref:Uncharacterized protein n=1 Tax=Trifolium pratense TaxID=57577 RepID=A0A2K3LJK6_TRIPR|nr:hypothetical protein L195_g034698 [Trifolium pratense]